MGSHRQIKRVSATELRYLFNSGGYWAQLQEGKVSARILERNHPSAPLANVPFCTTSELVSYIDGRGQEVARVHQYRLRDGTLGASGRPDPKYLLVGDTLYLLKHPL